MIKGPDHYKHIYAKHGGANWLRYALVSSQMIRPFTANCIDRLRKLYVYIVTTTIFLILSPEIIILTRYCEKLHFEKRKERWIMGALRLRYEPGVARFSASACQKYETPVTVEFTSVCGSVPRTINVSSLLHPWSSYTMRDESRFRWDE